MKPRHAELLAGDLLFNRTNSKELVGKTGLWDGRFDAVAASYFIRLRVNRERIVPAYLWAFFNTSHMKRVLFQTARGAIGQANINAKELRAFPVAAPPLPLQTAFAQQAQDNNEAALGRLVAELFCLRQMSRSVAGQLMGGHEPGLEAALVKDVGTSFEQSIQDLVREELPEALQTAGDLQRHFECLVLRSPSFTLRGGTTEILRGIVARGVGLR
jgi:hypothetical protein